jgi:GDSL-like lipase/acylhydrolase family protein
MRRWILVGASLVLALLVVEGLVRLRQWQRYGTTNSSYYDFAEDPATGLRIPEPGSVAGPIAVNSRGFRGPELEQPKPPGRIRVAFLGGSTTFCAEASSFEAGWPSLVVAGMRADAPDLDFDLVNASAGGFTLEQLLVNLEHRVAPLQPDVIVVYEATNDLVVDTRRLAIAAGLYEAEEGEDSALGEYWLTWFLLEKNVRQALRARRAREPLAFEPAELSRGFEQRLTRLVQAAQARSSVVVLPTFAIQLRAEQAPEAQRRAAASALFYMPFLTPAGLLAGYGEYNRVIRAVAAGTGVVLVEGEQEIPGDAEHFADSVHFRDPGNALQARRVLAGLLGSSAYQALLARRRAGPGG